MIATLVHYYLVEHDRKVCMRCRVYGLLLLVDFRNTDEHWPIFEATSNIFTAVGCRFPPWRLYRRSSRASVAAQSLREWGWDD
jgi:hypothetical protein